VACRRAADLERREDKRPDQHLDEAQEHIRENRDVPRHRRGGALVREGNEDHVADRDAEHEGAENQSGGRHFPLHGLLPLIALSGRLWPSAATAATGQKSYPTETSKTKAIPAIPAAIHA